MKYLLIASAVILFGWGSKVRIIQSTSQEWVGGLQESGYGTDYRLTIKAKAGSDLLQIEDLWIGDVHLKLRAMTDPADPRTTAFRKGQSVICKAGYTWRPGADERAELTGAEPLKKPYDYSGEGLVGYTFRGKKGYVEIASFEKLKKIIYP